MEGVGEELRRERGHLIVESNHKINEQKRREGEEETSENYPLDGIDRIKRDVKRILN